MPSDSPSQSVSSAISGRRSTIALFIPGIPTNPLRIHSLSSSLPCYWSTYNQYRSKRIVFTKRQALLILTDTYSSHQFPSQFLHVKGQECPQTARRNQSHQQSVEGEVQLRFSSQAFQTIHSLSLSLFLSLSLSLSLSVSLFQAYHATGLPAINIALRAFHSQSAKFLVSAQVSKIRKKAIRIQVRASCFFHAFMVLLMFSWGCTWYSTLIGSPFVHIVDTTKPAPREIDYVFRMNAISTVQVQLPTSSQFNLSLV